MSRTGRPRALSRATLEEAANELFLEQSYLLASIDDIAARAGVSRATFFNYFGQKSDLLFVTVDEALDTLEDHVATGATLREALHQTAQAFTRSRVPLVATQAEAMGALEDVLLAGPLRLVRLRAIVGMVVAEPVWQWAIAGAIVEGAIVWATSAPGHLDLADTLDAYLLELTKLPTHVKGVLVP